MTDDKIKEAFEEWWKRHQLKESSLDSDDAMYCFKYGYKAGLKEELQDKNNKRSYKDIGDIMNDYETIQIFLTALVTLFVSGYLAMVHWIFGLVWVAALGTAAYTAIKLIWGII